MPNAQTKFSSLLAAALIIAVGVAYNNASAEAAATEPTIAAKVKIKEWVVPNAGRARDPFAADDKTVWFVDQKSHALGRLNPTTGKLSKIDLPDDSGPHNVIAGNDGIVWYAGNLKGYIGRYDPEGGTFEKIAMPDTAAADPHTLIFDQDQSHIWFTVQNGNFVGRLTLSNNQVDLIKVPTEQARPYGIDIAPDGKIWVVLFGTHKLATVDPGTLKLTEIALPDDFSRPRRIAISADGNIWWADYTRGSIGAFDPNSKSFSDWPLPAKDKALPYGMAIDDSQRLWVVETGVQPNTFVGFDTGSKSFISTTKIPSGAGAVRHMHYHKPTQSVWFGTDAGTIGRAYVGPPESAP